MKPDFINLNRWNYESVYNNWYYKSIQNSTENTIFEDEFKNLASNKSNPLTPDVLKGTDLKKIKTNNMIITLTPMESDILKFVRFNNGLKYMGLSDFALRFVSKYTDYDDKKVKFHLNKLSASGSIITEIIEGYLLFFCK